MDTDREIEMDRKRERERERETDHHLYQCRVLQIKYVHSHGVNLYVLFGSCVEQIGGQCCVCFEAVSVEISIHAVCFEPPLEMLLTGPQAENHTDSQTIS